MKFGTKEELTIQINEKIQKVKIYSYSIETNNICKMTTTSAFVDFYKLYFLLRYNSEIDTKASVSESDSHLTDSFIPVRDYVGKTIKNLKL